MSTSTRKDLRTAESEWRGMSSAHRQHTKPLPKKRWSMKLDKFLKLLAMAVALIVFLSVLWDMQAKCEAAAGSNHILCTD